jgi:sugar phosphate isomerase/epimerase
LKLSIAIQSLRSCGLEEAAGIATALGFEAMDLDGVMGTTLDRDGILRSDPGEVRRVKSLRLAIPNIHWTFRPGSGLPPINDPDPSERSRKREQIKRLAEFCCEAGILSIMVLPGAFLPGQSASEAHRLSCDALNEFLLITQPAKVALMFEPHVGSSFESPTSAAWLAEHASGVGICLDYSHFICLGYTVPDVDPLIPYTTHVHLRQARSGLLQTELADGTINFALVLDKLRQAGYGGYLSVEYVHQQYIGATNVDIITETVKMRDFVRRHLP